MKNGLLAGFCFMIFLSSQAATLHVGAGYTYSSLSQAAAVAVAGDTILFHAGVYIGGEFVANLQGMPGNPITIMPAAGDTVIYRAGGTAWQLSDAAHLRIHDLIFEQQTANGLNMDDGGTYATPAHNIIFEGCTFRDMNASGNNDLLKLSGLDTFEINRCTFLNGSAGGSGIDMVGCHEGIIRNCHFENMGSNAIQAKGGTQFIRMEANFFKNAGARAVNLGGSTGLQFFRPIDAKFEAADLQVYSNIFIGSEAPIAYVGSERVDVINNTIYLPGKWVMRILQETVDTTRFAKCGNNSFRNNIIYRSNAVSADCNIGPNTDPLSFKFSNNLWFNYQNLSWGGPSLPVTDSNRVVGNNPVFNNASAEDFSIPPGSPATGIGYALSEPQFDFAGILFALPRSVGAFEGNPVSVNISSGNDREPFSNVYPNPFSRCATFTSSNMPQGELTISLFDLSGKKILEDRILSDSWCIPKKLEGIYFYLLSKNSETISKGKLMVVPE